MNYLLLGGLGTVLVAGCLLNCLDGVQPSHGVLTFLTTNHAEFLDQGVGGAGEGISSRPGRIDEILRFRELSEEGRRSLACRILSDCPHEIEAAVLASEGMTGAQFERYCSELALQHFWGDSTCEAKLTCEPSETS